MSLLTVRVDSSGLVPWYRQGTAAVVRAARMAGSDALRAMRTEASTQVRERKNLKLRDVNKAMTMDFSRADSLAWRLTCSASAMPLVEFGARQTKAGVSVEVTPGKRTVIRGAFIAEMKSGHRGVFYRVGKKRLPIDEMFSSRISDAFTDALPAIAERGLAAFRSTFDRVRDMKG